MSDDTDTNRRLVMGGLATGLLAALASPAMAQQVAIMAGDTRRFQTWHRDAVGGVATSNFTNGVSIAFN